MANRYYCRFTNIIIPKDADIRGCFVRFRAFDEQLTSTLRTNCHFVDADSPAAPISKAELDALSLTSGIAWDNLPAWYDGTAYQTPDLSALLETVVARAGWIEGNDLILVIEDDGSPAEVHRKLSAFEYSGQSERPSLHVAWYSAWDTFFDNTRWQPSQMNVATLIETAWDGTNNWWDFNINADSDGGELVAKGTWYNNYQPKEMRIYHNHAGTPELRVYAEDGIIFHTTAYTSGTLIVPLWAGRNEGIYRIRFVLSPADNDDFAVTNITFNSATPDVQTTTSTASTISTTSSTASTSTMSTTSSTSSTASTTSSSSSTSSTASTISTTSTLSTTSSSTSSTVSTVSTVSTGTTMTSFSTTSTSVSSSSTTTATGTTISTTSSTSSTASTVSTTSTTSSTHSTTSSTSSTASTTTSTTSSTHSTTSSTSSTASTSSTISTTSSTSSTASTTSTISTTSTTVTALPTTDIELDVEANGDDGRCKHDGSAFTNSSTLYFGENSGSYRSYTRFDNAAIPAGATIQSAILKITARNDSDQTVCNINIHFEAADDPSAPSNGADVIGRSLTSAVAWDAIPTWTGDVQYSSPELKTILQDVIDRGGWATGQALTIHLLDNGSDNYVARAGQTRELGPDPAILEVSYSE